MAGGLINRSGVIAATYSHRFAVAVARLIGTTEGGFVDDPKDHGGATKFGVSLRFLKAEGQLDASILHDFDIDMDGDLDGADIRGLSMSGAVELYWRCFWTRLNCESFPEPIGEMLFDQAVNDGNSAAAKLLQQAINACAAHIPGVARLTVDGALGAHTRTAMAAVLDHPGLGLSALCQAFRDAASARYRAIVVADPSQKRFLNGWLQRAAELGKGW